jgi:hypothetical protein
MSQAGALAGRGPKGAKGCVGETLRFLVKNVFIESRPPVNPKASHFWGEPPPIEGGNWLTYQRAEPVVMPAKP